MFRLSERDCNELEPKYKIPKPNPNPPQHGYYTYENDTWYKGDKGGNENIISGSEPDPETDPETDPEPDPETDPEPEPISDNETETPRGGRKYD